MPEKRTTPFSQKQRIALADGLIRMLDGGQKINGKHDIAILLEEMMTPFAHQAADSMAVHGRPHELQDASGKQLLKHTRVKYGTESPGNSGEYSPSYDKVGLAEGYGKASGTLRETIFHEIAHALDYNQPGGFTGREDKDNPRAQPWVLRDHEIFADIVSELVRSPDPKDRTPEDQVKFKALANRIKYRAEKAKSIEDKLIDGMKE